MARLLPFLLGLLAVGISAVAQQPPQEFIQAVSNREARELRFIVQTSSGLEQIFGMNSSAAHACLAESLSTCGRFSFDEEVVLPGATYACLAQLRPARFTGRDLFQASCEEVRLIRAPARGLMAMSDLKQRFLTNARGLDADSTALVAGLAIGDDSALSSEAQTALQAVSLTHLSAVSGANCAILIGVVFWLAGRLRLSRLFRFLLALLALVGYLLLVGPQPSVIRAGVMALAVLFVKTLGRRVSPLRALTSAVILILIVTPNAIWDVGFQLSVLATLGLLIAAPLVYQRLRSRLPKYLAAAIAVAFAAQLFCLPILLTLQPNLPVYSIPANLLAEPVVPIVTILGLIACLISPVLPLGTQLVTFIASFMTKWILLVADWLSNLPGAAANWPLGLAGLIAALVTVGLVVLWLKYPQQGWWLKWPLAALLAAIVITTSNSVIRAVAWLPNDWDVVSCDVGQGDGLVVRSRGKVVVVDVGRYPSKIDRCLDRLGVSTIDLLVLTHFDQDHIGGLEGAVKGRSVVAGMVSSASDERYAADQTRQLLSQVTQQVFEAELGLTGTLGDMTWQVLNPPRHGAGTEDFNDASVVMLFSGPAFDLLTLADLGERGQMRISERFQVWSSRLHEPFAAGVKPLLLKVAHHGSADIYPELYEALYADVALISVGAGNSYGHPTQTALNALERAGTAIYRTDKHGAIAIQANPSSDLRVAVSGKG